MIWKLAILSHTSDFGGREAFFLDLMSQFNPDRFGLLLVCPQPGLFTEEAKRRNINVSFFPFRPFIEQSVVENLKDTWRLHDFLCQEKVGLLHVTSYVTQPMASGAAKMAKIPNVCYVREFPNWREEAQPYFKAMIAASKVIVPSQAAARNLIMAGMSPEKIVLIYEGLDAERQPQASPADVRESLQLKPDTILVGMVGRPVPEKGHLEFLEAAKLLSEVFPEARFVMVTTQHHSRRPPAYLNSIINKKDELELGDKILIISYCPDILGLIGALDIVVVPSWFEATSRVALEAMALGKAVVATNKGGLPELIEHGSTGILVEPRDGGQLFAAIKELIENPQLRASLAEAGRSRVKRDFSIQGAAGIVDNLYSNLL